MLLFLAGYVVLASTSGPASCALLSFNKLLWTESLLLFRTALASLLFRTARLCNLVMSTQVMGSNKCQHIEDEIGRERNAGRATYFGESMELIGALQLQQS